jgi:hypothetical protein
MSVFKTHQKELGEFPNPLAFVENIKSSSKRILASPIEMPLLIFIII